MSQETPKVRVLLVEDDEGDAAIFCRHISRLIHQSVSVECVAGEQKAFSRLAEERFDLIFIDLNLGGSGSGIDLLTRLQRERLDVPAIVVTGSGDETKAVAAMKSGAYDYILKDNLSADLLERTIRNALERRALEKERERMIQKLRELTVTDELTGLGNRRHLTLKLEDEIRRSKRTGHLFAVLMLDIDHFKRVNDSCGHQKGDEVLKQCADALRRSVRGTDFVARYGGEEFCVLLLETSHRGALAAAERLRGAVAALPDPVPTVSVGAAFWRPDTSGEEILSGADRALYEAKETGRNRVVLWEG